MNRLLLFLIFFMMLAKSSKAQVLLDADGPGNTYELINSVFAPGYDVVEAPDCSHTEFGRHIDEVFDNELNSNVFRFFIHTTPDNDRCKNFDRQRNEIKTYDKSPDNLKGISGEIVRYKWKFKLPEGFKSSSKFTHIHQLKSVGGSLESMPMYTLTTRKGTPDKLELRYAETDKQVTLKQIDLTPLKGVWVEVLETITYGVNGTYEIELTSMNDGSTLFYYANSSIINWRAGAEFVRPKWGIYRSLDYSEDLRDETLLFANFSIEELSVLSVNILEHSKKRIEIIPNPSNGQVFIKENTSNTFNSVVIYDSQGRIVKSIEHNSNNNVIDTINLTTGIYVLVFKNRQNIIDVQKLVVN